MKYIVSAHDRSIKTNKTNLASAIQTLIDEGYEKVTVQVETVESIDTVPKFKEGDTVRVVSNILGHDFEIGEVVTIVNIVFHSEKETYYRAISDVFGDWVISKLEIESIKS